MWPRAGAVVVTSDPPRGARRPTAWCSPGRARCPTACASSTRAACASAVLEAARSKPFLGVCIGLQMLFEHSEEGDMPGLGLLPGQVRALSACAGLVDSSTASGSRCRTWAGTRCSRRSTHPLWAGIAGPQPVLLRAQLLSCPGATRDHCRVYSLYPFPFTCAVAAG